MYSNKQFSSTSHPSAQARTAQRKAAYRRRQRRLALLKFLFILLVVASAFYLAYRLFHAIAPPASIPSETLDDSNHTAPEAELTFAEKLQIIEETPEEYPEPLIQLASKYDQTIDYVYYYPEYKDKSWEIDLSAEASSGQVPLLLQWDRRWGYSPYGTGMIGYTGCGPTSLSMVALYLLEDAKWSPLEMAKFAVENGYCSPGHGSTWSLISEGSTALGLHASSISLHEGRMKQELDAGNPIIVVVGPGDFTNSGHFMVLTGYDDTGFFLNDPNSRENSEKTWTFSVLRPQIKALWAISKP